MSEDVVLVDNSPLAPGLVPENGLLVRPSVISPFATVKSGQLRAELRKRSQALDLTKGLMARCFVSGCSFGLCCSAMP